MESSSSSSSSSSSPPTWPSLLSSMTERASKQGILEQLKNNADSITDFGHPIRILSDNLFVKSRKCATWLSTCLESRAEKCGSLASRLRDEGNLTFKRRDFVMATKLYTESIICAPKASPELSLAYGNRSAALFHLNKHADVIKDVDLALKHSFLAETNLKLHQRKARSLGLLGRHQQALESLHKALEAVEKTRFKNGATKEATIKDLKALINEGKRAVSVNDRPDENNGSVNGATPEDVESEENEFVANAGLPGASSCLLLSHHPVRNRCIVTASAIPVGSLLFSEQPYCSVLLPEQASSHCHHCHVSIEAPVACLRCTQPRYCSESCRAQSWTEYHEHECLALHLLQSVGVAHLALRTVLRAGKDRVIRVAEAAKLSHIDKEDNLREDEEDKDYKRVFNLETNEQRSDDLFQYAATAILLAMFLSQRTAFFNVNKKNFSNSILIDGVNEKDEEKERQEVDLIASIILRHIVQMVNNASAIYEVGSQANTNSNDGNADHVGNKNHDCVSNGDDQDNRVYATVQYRIATAIYPSASMMNHSCEPSVINSFVGGRQLMVRSIVPLKKNEEVFNCYGPHYARHSRQERQEMLKSQYNFDCDCHRCTEGDSYELKFSAFKCPMCENGLMSNPFILRQRSKKSESYKSRCVKCDKESDMNHVVGHVFNAQKLHDRAKECINRGHLDEALKCLKKCLELRQEVMIDSNQEVMATLDQLACVHAMMEHFEDSLECVSRCLPIVEERYGPYSIEVGHELVKQSDLLLITAPTKAIKSLGRALTVFKLHYGPDHESVLEIKEKLSKLKANE